MVTGCLSVPNLGTYARIVGGDDVSNSCVTAWCKEVLGAGGPSSCGRGELLTHGAVGCGEGGRLSRGGGAGMPLPPLIHTNTNKYITTQCLRDY